MPPSFDLDDRQEIRELLFNKPWCRKPFNFMYIRSSGKVYPCEHLIANQWYLGDFAKQGFKEIWRGRAYKKIRKQFRLSIYTEGCRNCPVWGGNSLESYSFRERELYLE
jgi:radical SAM protein with 4Fe4S-binding SPASM domain